MTSPAIPGLQSTVADAKRFLRKNAEVGVDCPCCGQFVCFYRYTITAVTAYALIRLYRLPAGYHHVRSFAEGQEGVRRASHWAELRFWGLVEEQLSENDPTKRKSGFWAITPKGRAFVEGLTTVPSHVWIYNGKPLRFEDTAIDIRAALKERFDYSELMGR